MGFLGVGRRGLFCFAFVKVWHISNVFCCCPLPLRVFILFHILIDGTGLALRKWGFYGRLLTSALLLICPASKHMKGGKCWTPSVTAEVSPLELIYGCAATKSLSNLLAFWHTLDFLQVKKKNGEREKNEIKKFPENFLLKICAKIKNLNLSVLKRRLGMLEKFSLIFRSGAASQQYFTCNRKSLDSDTSKIF